MFQSNIVAANSLVAGIVLESTGAVPILLSSCLFDLVLGTCE